MKALFRNEGNQRETLRPIEEWCFRYELGILLDERTAKLSVQTEGDFAIQDADYICAEIQKRIETNHARYPSFDEIKQYLKNVSTIMQNLLAQGHDVSALAYLSKGNRKRAGRPKIEAKRGKKRPIEIDGVPYESIAAANRAKRVGYQFLQKTTLAQIKDENRL